MAGNFFTGLSDQMNVNDKQRNQDDYIEMLRQRQRMADVSAAVQSERADEEMGMRRDELGMRREAAIRAQRDSDFAFNQRQKELRDLESHKNDLANLETSYWGPQPKLVNGKQVMKPDGTPETYTRDPNSMGDRIGFYREALNVGRKYTKTTPELIKYFDAEKSLAASGNEEILKGVYRNDEKSQALAGQMLGFSGPATLREGRDQYGLPQFTFVGVDKDGKPRSMDYTQGLLALGSASPGVQGARRAEAVTGQKLTNDSRDSNSRAVSASAAAVRAARSGGGGGSDDDGNGVPDKVDARNSKRANSITREAAKNSVYSASFGSTPAGMDPPTDGFRQGKQIEFSLRALDRSPKLTDAEITLKAMEAFDSIESAAVSGRKYVKDGDGYRPATSADKKATDFRSIPFGPWKVQERNRLFNEQFAKQQEEYARRQEAERAANSKQQGQAIPRK